MGLSVRIRAACLSAALLAILGCGGTEDAPAGSQSTPSVTRSAVFERGPFERSLLLTGELEAVRSIEVKSPQTAMFQLRILFMADEGSTVEPGDPLIGFDDSSLADRVRVLEAEILNAEIAILSSHNQLASQLKDLEIELAEKQFERDRAALLASIDPEVLSRKEYSERQLAFSKAEESLAETQERLALTQGRGTTQAEVLRIDREKKKKDLRTARSDLSLLTIQAPAAGLVVFATRDRTTTKHQEGDSCWPGQVLVSLPDLSEMKAVFLVNEVDAPQLEVGMPIEIDLDAFPGQTVSGQIEHIPSMAVRRSDSSKIAIFRVEATLSETWSDGMMKPGMSARGRVVLDRHADAPLVARGSVASDGETYWLFTASGRTTIDPIARNSTHYLLTEDAWSQLTVTAPEAGGATGVKDAAP